MAMQSTVTFFKPSLWIVSLTVTFIIMAVIAQFQIWPSDAQIIGVQKPPFYDEFKPYHFVKHISFLVSIPLLILSFATVPGFFNPPLLEIFTPLGAFAGIIYYYLLSCLIVQLFRNMKWDNESWRQAQGIKS